MAGLEDNSTQERTSAHQNADTGPSPDRNAGSGVAGRMFLSVICGAFVGVLLAIILAPDFLLAFAVGGAMSFGAGAVMLVLFKSQDADPQGGVGTKEEAREK